jgi:hypothetical protein
MLLYKFTNEKGLKILSRLELKVKPPGKFNDPFEFALSGITFTKKDKEQFIRRNREKLYKLCKKCAALIPKEHKGEVLGIWRFYQQSSLSDAKKQNIVS